LLQDHPNSSVSYAQSFWARRTVRDVGNATHPLYISARAVCALAVVLGRVISARPCTWSVCLFQAGEGVNAYCPGCRVLGRGCRGLRLRRRALLCIGGSPPSTTMRCRGPARSSRAGPAAGAGPATGTTARSRPDGARRGNSPGWARSADARVARPAWCLCSGAGHVRGGPARRLRARPASTTEAKTHATGCGHTAGSAKAAAISAKLTAVTHHACRSDGVASVLSSALSITRRTDVVRPPHQRE